MKRKEQPEVLEQQKKKMRKIEYLREKKILMKLMRTKKNQNNRINVKCGRPRGNTYVKRGNEKKLIEKIVRS